MTYTYAGLMNAVANLVSFLIRIAGLTVVVVIVWFGLRMVTAKGDPKKYSDAKKGLTWALVGAAVTFGVWTIILTVRAFVDSIGR